MSFETPIKNKSLVFNTIRELYNYLKLPTKKGEEYLEFTIHDLKDIHRELPVTSPVFRPNFFSFVFVKDAYGKYTTDELTFDTVPKMVYFTNPGHYKSFRWDQIEEVCLITISESFLRQNVHSDIFEEFPFLLSETVKPSVLRPDDWVEIESLYGQIMKEHTSVGPYRNKIIGSLLVVLLLRIKEYFWKDYPPIHDGDNGSKIVIVFRKLLEKHYRDLREGVVNKAYRIQDYADELQLHPSYLSNVVKAKTGKPVGTWITERTIIQAKFLLHNSNLSIKEIAFQLGFSESSYFSSYFKKNTRVTPLHFRKNR